MLTALAHTCYRRRRRVLVAWLGLLITAVVVMSTFGGELRNDFTLPGSPSQEAADLLKLGGFSGEAGQRGQIVFAADGGVDDPPTRSAMEAFFSAVEAGVAEVVVRSPYDGASQISADGTVAIADVEFGDVDLDTAMDRATQVAALRDETPSVDGLQVELGGELFYEESEFASEGLGMVAAAVILLVAFGSVLAMGLPLVVALVAIVCAMAIVMVTAHLMTIPDFAPAAVAMVTIGVGIDYALFLVTRYREELAAGRDPQQAVVTSVATAGRAVLFAGSTVVIALLGLLVVGLASTQALAVAISAGVLMVMAVSLTLLPALLGFAGDRIDRLSWKRRPHHAGAASSVWYRWSRTVQRRPVVFTAIGLVGIVALTAPVASMRLGFGDASNRPEGDTARAAHELVADGFGPGFNGPLFVAVDLGEAPVDPAALARVEAALDAEQGVAFAAPGVIGETGAVAVVQAFPTTAPQDEATSELVRRLRADLPHAAGSDTTVHVGGAVATVVDFAEVQSSRMPLFIAAVLVVSFVVLMAVFRSVTVAAKAVVLNLLSIGAAYGIVVAVFQWGWGGDLLGLGEPGPIEAWAPMMLFAILFGLSMDYEVFLLSRIKEEYDRTGDNASAVADGLARTARIITAAAAIMIFVFGGFVLSDERALQIFGLGLAAAIAVDVTVVRLLLVPATMELLGDRNWWWPDWLDRLLPRPAVDGPPLVGRPDGHPVDDAQDLARTPTLDDGGLSSSGSG